MNQKLSLLDFIAIRGLREHDDYYWDSTTSTAIGVSLRSSTASSPARRC